MQGHAVKRRKFKFEPTTEEATIIIEVTEDHNGHVQVEIRDHDDCVYQVIYNYEEKLTH